MRVLEERSDIAYAKTFFHKSGYITKAWYPYFLSARRQNQSFDEAYRSGTVSHEAKLIYDAIREHGAVALHALKALSNLGQKENKSRFDRGLLELQTRLFITMCARQQKQSQSARITAGSPRYSPRSRRSLPTMYMKKPPPCPGKRRRRD